MSNGAYNTYVLNFNTGNSTVSATVTGTAAKLNVAGVIALQSVTNTTVTQTISNTLKGKITNKEVLKAILNTEDDADIAGYTLVAVAYDQISYFGSNTTSAFEGQSVADFQEIGALKDGVIDICVGNASGYTEASGGGSLNHFSKKTFDSSKGTVKQNGYSSMFLGATVYNPNLGYIQASLGGLGTFRETITVNASGVVTGRTSSGASTFKATGTASRGTK